MTGCSNERRTNARPKWDLERRGVLFWRTFQLLRHLIARSRRHTQQQRARAQIKSSSRVSLVSAWGNSHCFVSSRILLIMALFNLRSGRVSIFLLQALPSHVDYYWIVTEHSDAELADASRLSCISKLQSSPGPPFCAH